MFILRCTFWLSVMYAFISFGVGALRAPHAFEAALASEAATVGSAAVARATDWCVERPGRCARDAASLDALVLRVAANADDAFGDAAQNDGAVMAAPDARRVRPGLTPTR